MNNQGNAFAFAGGHRVLRDVPSEAGLLVSVFRGLPAPGRRFLGGGVGGMGGGLLSSGRGLIE